MSDLEIRKQLTKALRLDDSHGPMPASMGFILASIDALMRQVAGPSAKLMSEPMVKCETERLRERVRVLERHVCLLESFMEREHLMQFEREMGGEG
jgi:hypothetical protein